jgi:hypothetical protein
MSGRRLLEEAGVREARLHTTATTLLLLGVPERAVMDFMMGWSTAAMVKRYAHSAPHPPA